MRLKMTSTGTSAASEASSEVGHDEQRVDDEPGARVRREEHLGLDAPRRREERDDRQDGRQLEPRVSSRSV